MCKTELPPTPDVNPEEARIGWERRNPRVAWCPTAGELTPESRDTFPNRTGELGGGLPGPSRPDPRPQQRREEPGPHGASLRPNSQGACPSSRSPWDGVPQLLQWKQSQQDANTDAGEADLTYGLTVPFAPVAVCLLHHLKESA